MGQNKHDQHHSSHHILPVKTALAIGGILLFMTAVTVWVAHIDLGKLNFLIAMLVATFKALLVCLFFMGLKYDHRENAMIFASSFLFLAIFLGLTSMDLFFRGDVYVHGPITMASSGKSKLKKPWISTPELVKKGKELFAQQCVSCHGLAGQGDGVAAAALNPRPRNFTASEGWKNGRRPTMVFKTLKEGIPNSGMASFATIPSDDRWALVHYVLSLGSAPETDGAADFAKVGIDPTQENGGEKGDDSIPVDVAMEQISVHETTSEARAEGKHLGVSLAKLGDFGQSQGARLYGLHCATCHGGSKDGVVKTHNLGVNPVAFVKTRAFSQGFEDFSRAVVRGIPGDIMPGFGQLSASELKDLYQFVQSMR